MTMKPIDDVYTQPFWEALDDGDFLIHQCEACDNHFFPPSPICPQCHSREVVWRETDGSGTVYSFTQQHVAVEGFDLPIVLGLIELDEDVRLLSSIEATYDELAIGQSVVLQPCEYVGGFDRGEFADYPYFTAVPVDNG